jgi:hypothetical protein
MEYYKALRVATLRRMISDLQSALLDEPDKAAREMLQKAIADLIELYRIRQK